MGDAVNGFCSRLRLRKQHLRVAAGFFWKIEDKTYFSAFIGRQSLDETVCDNVSAGNRIDDPGKGVPHADGKGFRHFYPLFFFKKQRRRVAPRDFSDIYTRARPAASKPAVPIVADDGRQQVEERLNALARQFRK